LLAMTTSCDSAARARICSAFSAELQTRRILDLAANRGYSLQYPTRLNSTASSLVIIGVLCGNYNRCSRKRPNGRHCCSFARDIRWPIIFDRSATFALLTAVCPKRTSFAFAGFIVSGRHGTKGTVGLETGSRETMSRCGLAFGAAILITVGRPCVFITSREFLTTPSKKAGQRLPVQQERKETAPPM
jgi:hypothetical protein